MLLDPKSMIRTYQLWEKNGCPRVPFPTAYMARCLFTLYFFVFVAALLFYGAFIMVAIFAIFYLIYSYLLYMKLFALLGLSRLRFALFFIPTSAVVAALAVLLRNAFIKLVVGG